MSGTTNPKAPAKDEAAAPSIEELEAMLAEAKAKKAEAERQEQLKAVTAASDALAAPLKALAEAAKAGELDKVREVFGTFRTEVSKLADAIGTTAKRSAGGNGGPRATGNANLKNEIHDVVYGSAEPVTVAMVCKAIDELPVHDPAKGGDGYKAGGGAVGAAFDRGIESGEYVRIGTGTKAVLSPDAAAIFAAS